MTNMYNTFSMLIMPNMSKMSRNYHMSRFFYMSRMSDTFSISCVPNITKMSHLSRLISSKPLKHTKYFSLAHQIWSKTMAIL